MSNLADQNPASFIDNIGAIPDGALSVNYRRSTENKNLLQEKGSLYVGTGETNDLTFPGTSITHSTAKTIALSSKVEGAHVSGRVLTTDDNPESDTGLKWVEMFKEEALISGGWTNNTVSHFGGKYRYTIKTQLLNAITSITVTKDVASLGTGYSDSQQIVYCDTAISKFKETGGDSTKYCCIDLFSEENFDGNIYIAGY